VHLRALLADDVRAKAAVRPGGVAVVANALWQIENDRDRQAVKLAC
jgi:hypothetical protein